MTKKQLVETKIRTIVRKIISELYSGERNFHSEKSAIETVINKKFPIHNKKFIKKSSPNGQKWETFVPEWNTQKPSNEYNPTIEYSYKIKVEKGQKFPTVYWWLNEKNYK